MPEDEFTVLGDGTWSKRGLNSLISVSTVIGKYTNKILDYFVSSKHCKTCETKRPTLNSVDFDIWFESEHSEMCTANYEGISGGMDVQGMKKILNYIIIYYNIIIKKKRRASKARKGRTKRKKF